MTNNEIIKRYEEMAEKIEKLTQVTREQKDELKYETMLKTLKSSMAITKEQLDVTLSAKSQAEQHIMNFITTIQSFIKSPCFEVSVQSSCAR